MTRRSFASRFPKVAALLAGSAFSSGGRSAPADDGDDDDREQGGGAGNQVDADALQTAFERDAGALVDAERKRWNDVIGSDEGKANPQGARSLLFRTDMDSAGVIETLKDMAAGKPQRQPEGRGGRDDDNDDDDRESGRRSDTNGGDRRRSMRQGRDRLRGSNDVDHDTGGAGGKERGGGADDLEAGRARRQQRREERNSQTMRSGRVPGRGARRRTGTAD